MSFFEQVQEIGIMPVVKITDASKAVSLANALIQGGLPAAEVTFRTPAAAKAIKEMSSAFPDMCLCAGTILNVEQAKAAVEAGAKAIISPGQNIEVIDWCIAAGIPVIPGCATPTEVERCIRKNLKIVKLFPAEVVGGVEMLKALYGPYSNMFFMPTGGVSSENIVSYLKLPNVLACGGSWMVPQKAIDDNNFDSITELTSQACHKMLGFEFRHLGINATNPDEALDNTQSFKNLFNLRTNETPISYFAGSAIEIMKEPGYGVNGHIAIGTHHVPRAMRYLKQKGVDFIPESAQFTPEGKLKLIYLKDPIQGFNIHLIHIQ